MRELRLTAVSEDGAYLILSEGDEQFALRADERLHAAIRGDRARLGQLEIQLESQLRPRDIQARVRAGESVESVAAAATMPLDKVRRFASPVLAEREHIADRARQANIRRVAGEGPVRTLEDAALDYAASLGAEPETLEWDAWKADDGRWRVRCSWQADTEQLGNDEPAAVFSFDPSGRSVTALDTVARQVAGEPRPEPEPAPPVEEAGPARLSVVRSADDEPSPMEHPLGLGDAPAGPVAALVRDDEPDGPDEDVEHTGPIEPVARRPRRTGRYGRPERRRRDAEPWDTETPDTETPDTETPNARTPDAQIPDAEAPDAESMEDTAATDRLHLSDIASRVEESDNDPHDEPLAPTAQEEAPPATRRRSSKSRRPSVPSWDEIMFGRRKDD